MINRNNKIAIMLAGLFEIIIIYTAILNIISNQWKDLAQACLAIVCITIPFILTKIANKKQIVLPSSFQLITVMFIVFSLYFGEINKFYKMFWWWDLFLHGFFGIYAVIVGVFLAERVFEKDSDVTKKRFAISITIFAFCFAIALGTLWEIFEFVGDFLFKTTMLDEGLEDTMLDLIVKSICAFITSLICFFRKIKK